MVWSAETEGTLKQWPVPTGLKKAWERGQGRLPGEGRFHQS